jgi:mRNA-degrading endonuclease RelE of RelBE toxin-antitoxin system
MKTTFEAEALDEYQEAAQYSEERFGMGRQFVASMQAAIASIEKTPARYQSVGQGIRIFRMKRLPYYLFYHYDKANQTITIYAVAHHKRQPGYWLGRLPE